MWAKSAIFGVLVAVVTAGSALAAGPQQRPDGAPVPPEEARRVTLAEFGGRAPQVVGGREVSPPGRYPWMVSVQQSSHFCGGTLITPRHVLTAAHCVTNGSGAQNIATSALRLVIGRHDLTTTSGEVIGASAVHVHPSWNGDGDGLFDHDVAVITLARPSAYPPVTLATPSDAGTWDAGDPGTTMGWGDTDGTWPWSATSRLQSVDVPFTSDAQCTAAWGQWFVPGTQICAGDLANGGVDSCVGDSGGPIVAPPGPGPWRQVGIVSSGPVPCGKKGEPGMYAFVPALRPFIEQVIAPRADTTAAFTSAGGDRAIAVILEGPNRLVARRVHDGALLSDIPLGTLVPIDLEVVPDPGGDPDLAVLGLTPNGTAHVRVLDPITKATRGTVSFGNKLTSLDLEVAGTDLALLATNQATGTVLVWLKNLGGSLDRQVSFGGKTTGDDLEVVGGNLAVLGRRHANSAPVIRVKSTNGANVGSFGLGTKYTADDLEAVGNDLAVLGTDGGGKVVVRTKTVANGLVGVASFGTKGTGTDLEVVGGHLAVLGVRHSDGLVAVQRRTVDGTTLAAVTYPGMQTAEDLIDAGGDFAVRGRSGGTVQVEVRTATNGAVATLPFG